MNGDQSLQKKTFNEITPHDLDTCILKHIVADFSLC